MLSLSIVFLSEAGLLLGEIAVEVCDYFVHQIYAAS